MMIIATVALIITGVYLAMRWLAALYLLIDLRYTWRSAWPRMARAITIWTAVPAALALWLAPAPRAALLWGFGAYVVFYVLVALILSEVLIPRLLSARPR